ncbi:hypothetical protein AOZ06_40845 [Kibdelosporangium phytohabitans]|uniref:Uncharacterized protein n=1 Tax=Kibdelosporangium phytohabitans TaxID=860235 RepID=A0A0N9I852_9PSEU|nr:hypothetical protein AOZ06_40845 [Kibdelosporangium phytohabitans]
MQISVHDSLFARRDRRSFDEVRENDPAAGTQRLADLLEHPGPVRHVEDRLHGNGRVEGARRERHPRGIGVPELDPGYGLGESVGAVDLFVAVGDTGDPCPGTRRDPCSGPADTAADVEYVIALPGPQAVGDEVGQPISGVTERNAAVRRVPVPEMHVHPGRRVTQHSEPVIEPADLVGYRQGL